MLSDKAKCYQGATHSHAFIFFLISDSLAYLIIIYISQFHQDITQSYVLIFTDFHTFTLFFKFTLLSRLVFQDSSLRSE